MVLLGWCQWDRDGTAVLVPGLVELRRPGCVLALSMELHRLGHSLLVELHRPGHALALSSWSSAGWVTLSWRSSAGQAVPLLFLGGAPQAGSLCPCGAPQAAPRPHCVPCVVAAPALPSSVRQRLVEPQHGHGSQRLVESVVPGQPEAGPVAPLRAGRVSLRRMHSLSSGQSFSSDLPGSSPSPASTSTSCSSSTTTAPAPACHVHPIYYHHTTSYFLQMDSIPDLPPPDVTSGVRCRTGSFGDLTRCDSDSSIPHLSEQQRVPSPAPKLLAARPALLSRSVEENVPAGPAAPTPNGGGRHGEPPALAALQERLPESPMAMKKMMMVNHGMEKSSSLGEISHPAAGKPSHSDSSRSHSPSSTEPDTPSPISDCRPGGARNTRIPQLAAKKSPGDEDSSLTGDEVDLGQSKKKFPLKIFKKPKK
uniref:Uncharacterized protein n=1 Tax=Taeniopygia guttata TaxID=59729 RepID=A0A674H2M3_TAEGU